MSELSAADVAAIKDSGGMFGGSGVTLIVLILFFLTMGNGGLFGAANNAAAQGSLTRAELADGLNTQTVQADLRGIQSAICDSNASNMLAMNNGFNSINANINNLASQMAQSCCDIKTTILGQMQANVIQDLRDQLSAKDRELLTTGLTAAQVVQTNNLESYMRQLINGSCCCGA